MEIEERPVEVTLKFYLPEHLEDFQNAVNGNKWYSVVWDLDQKFRAMAKYEDINEIDVDKARELIREIMADHGLMFEP